MSTTIREPPLGPTSLSCVFCRLGLQPHMITEMIRSKHFWLVVSTHLKNMLVKMGIFPKFRMKIKKIFEQNHHLDFNYPPLKPPHVPFVAWSARPLSSSLPHAAAWNHCPGAGWHPADGRRRKGASAKGGWWEEGKKLGESTMVFNLG